MLKIMKCLSQGNKNSGSSGSTYHSISSSISNSGDSSNIQSTPPPQRTVKEKFLPAISLPSTAPLLVPEDLGPNSGISLKGYHADVRRLPENTLRCDTDPSIRSEGWAKVIAGIVAKPQIFTKNKAELHGHLASALAAQRTKEQAQALAQALSEIYQVDRLFAALLPALSLVAPEDAVLFTNNCRSIFYGAKHLPATDELASAIMWLAVEKPSIGAVGQITSVYLSLAILRARAAAALCVHNLITRPSRYQGLWGPPERGTDWQSGLEREAQRETYTSLAKLLSFPSPPEDFDTFLATARALMAIPIPFYQLLFNRFNNASEANEFAAVLTKSQPDDSEKASEMIGELIALREKELAYQRLLKEGYAKLTKPDEGGASSVRTDSLSVSINQLLKQVKKFPPSPPAVTYGQILHYINSTGVRGVNGGPHPLDFANCYGHTPRQKALHALNSLGIKGNGKTTSSTTTFHFYDNQEKQALSQFGVVALAWTVIVSHSIEAERQLLSESFCWALSHCLKEENEALGVLPDINCRRGYNEQMMTIFSGYGYKLAIETAYQSARPKELIYALAPAFHADIRGGTPTAENIQKFHKETMQRCIDLIEEGSANSSVAQKNDEKRKAMFELVKLCKEMGWPVPLADLYRTHGLSLEGAQS